MRDSDQEFAILPGDGCQTVVMLRQQPAGKAGSFLAAGYCMAPTILPGDDLVVEDCPGRPRRGWIAVFPWRDRLLAHRIVRVQGDRFWSRGDAVLDEEGPIPTSAILGRVTGRVRDGKKEMLPSGGGVNALRFAAREARARLLRVLRRHPELRELAERRLLGSEAARRVRKMASAWLLGRVDTEESTGAAKAFGEFISQHRLGSGEALREFESRLAGGELVRVVARSSRLGRVGSASMVVLTEGDGKIGLLANAWADRLVRRMGIGRKLVMELVEVAGAKQVAEILAGVDAEDLRVLSWLHAIGFERVEGADLGSLSALLGVGLVLRLPVVS